MSIREKMMEQGGYFFVEDGPSTYLVKEVFDCDEGEGVDVYTDREEYIGHINRSLSSFESVEELYDACYDVD